MEKYKEPQIYIINNLEIAEKMQEKYVVKGGNLGTLKQIKFKEDVNRIYVSLDYDLINNLHEYKVIILDMQSYRIKKDCSQNDVKKELKHLYQIDYPEYEFDPAPFVVNQISEKMSKGSLRIIFADKSYGVNYKLVEIVKQNHVSSPKEFVLNIYGTISAKAKSKSGEKIKVKDYILAQTVGKYVIGYNAIFYLPTVWNAEKREYVIHSNYIPLVLNQEDEVIAYWGYKEETGYELILPLCKDKEKLIDELFSNILPEIVPNIFPESKEFRWINDNDFKTKEMLVYEKKKEELEKEYNNKLLELEAQEKVIYKRYQFLNELLTQTGNTLVKAVCKYLEWLGFSNVQEIDGQEEILREDIQIIDGNDLFIIEVKGIGGTSTDSECAQVAKHRRRREKENRDKNIFPLYIVNHQRYMQPKLRQNPPFTADQIDYAQSDERGLLTTWQLYKQFKLIEDGIFTKEETRQAMKNIGLITLFPGNFYSIGTVIEYFKKPNACIIIIKDIEIRCGEYIWAKKDDMWKKGRICSIQIDNKDVDIAKNCEVGIVLDIELAKGFELFGKSENE